MHVVLHTYCTSQAGDKIPPIKPYQKVITNIYYYFKYSSCINVKMKSIMCLLDSPKLKFREVHSVRWLRFYNALDVIYRSMGPLLTYLAEALTKNPKALGLKKKVKICSADSYFFNHYLQK